MRQQMKLIMIMGMLMMCAIMLAGCAGKEEQTVVKEEVPKVTEYSSDITEETEAVVEALEEESFEYQIETEDNQEETEEEVINYIYLEHASDEEFDSLIYEVCKLFDSYLKYSYGSALDFRNDLIMYLYGEDIEKGKSDMRYIIANYEDFNKLSALNNFQAIINIYEMCGMKYTYNSHAKEDLAKQEEEFKKEIENLIEGE